MSINQLTVSALWALIKSGSKLHLATQHYPSRGQSAVQELYQTSEGKFFLKKVSRLNHVNCRIDTKSGTLAEREYWAYSLANSIGLVVPPLWLMDKNTTVQLWLDYPDACQYSTREGAMIVEANTIFNCALFDWLTGQIDRHDGNYLYNFSQREIILIDSAHSFLKFNGSLPDYLKLYEVAQPSQLRKKRHTAVSTLLRQLTRTKLQQLIPLRNTQEQDTLFLRFKQIIQVDTIQAIINLYREVH